MKDATQHLNHLPVDRDFKIYSPPRRLRDRPLLSGLVRPTDHF